jgi:hypothetical protein
VIEAGEKTIEITRIRITTAGWRAMETWSDHVGINHRSVLSTEKQECRNKRATWRPIQRQGRGKEGSRLPVDSRAES